jgi:two-component system chemotaxis sensor kinase CheA
MLVEIEELCEAAVLADLSDLRTLSKLIAGFEALAALSGQGKNGDLAAVCQACLKRINAIILEDIKDGRGELEKICLAAKALQKHLRQEVALTQCGMPEDLYPAAPAANTAIDLDAGMAKWEMPQNVDASMVAEFLSRQPAVLDDAEALILKLGDAATQKETVETLRGLLHNLKGESALLGMHSIEQLCHKSEELLKDSISTAAAEVLLRVTDWLRKALAFFGGTEKKPSGLKELIAALKQCDAKSSKAAMSVAPAAPVPVAPLVESMGGDLSLVRDFITESREHLENAVASLLALENDPVNKENLDALFRAFHTIKGCAGFLMLNQIQSLAHECENLLDKARNGTLVLSGPALDAVFDATDALKDMLDHLQAALSTGIAPPVNPATASLVEAIRAVASGKAGESAAAAKPCATESLPVAPVGESLIGSSVMTVAPVGQEAKQPRGNTLKVKDAMRVDADRLDRMIDMIGELVISESMVSQSPDLRRNASAQLTRHIAQLDKITRELQEMAMSLRMMPVKSTFQKMGRLVHDLAKRTGKKVELAVSGEDTELDKGVVDGIGDPLVHMIRNAVDHGLEATSEARVKAGKPETGRIDLRAFHKGGNIVIEVQDDGRGLDREAILKKATERGLIREGEQLSDRDIFNLIFLPGFSTAKVVTDVSGRGVGMDVVRKNIDALRGQVEIQSQAGVGTKFSIRLPLTLAIIDGMVVRVGRERYIIPTISIVMSLRTRTGDVKSILNRGEMLSFQGDLIPLFRIDRTFGIEGAVSVPEDGLVIIVEEDGRRAGLLADALLGQQQIVIKTLGESMRGIPGISGGAIMPDGNVGLIMDVGGLVRLSQNAQGVSNPAGELVA